MKRKMKKCSFCHGEIRGKGMRVSLSEVKKHILEGHDYNKKGYFLVEGSFCNTKCLREKGREKYHEYVEWLMEGVR